MAFVADISSADRRLLEQLQKRSVEFAPVLAAAVGINHEAAADSCERLVRTGYVERVTEESVYRLTDVGELSLEWRHFSEERD